MDEINVIFRGSMYIVSKKQGKKLEREISLAQRNEPGRRMKWSDTNILFGHEDHPDTTLSNRNLPFVVMLSIGRHKVVKTLVENGASLNLIMAKTFIKMVLNLLDLTPVHDTFHSVIPEQLSTPIECIDLEVSCGSGDNKHREMLTFEVTRFDISYNCNVERPFILKFIATMLGSKGVITIKADQRDTLACENALLSHIGWLGDKAAQEQAAKAIKTQGVSYPHKESMSEPPTSSTP
jgi:hypothetical protein